MNKTQETNSIRAMIYDREYALLTDGDPEYLRELCAVMDERMRNIAAATGTVDTPKLTMLAALSFADDACRAKEGAIKLDAAIDRRSTICVSIIEGMLS